ncbi:MAG: S8 family serine peptidase [Anaerolineae bacterium]|nr:S8 family serine peptidase [Anaerolineae bacterium]
MRLLKLLLASLLIAALAAPIIRPATPRPANAQDGDDRPTHYDLTPAEIAQAEQARADSSAAGGDQTSSGRLAGDLLQLYHAYQLSVGQGGVAGGNAAIAQTAQHLNLKIKNNDRVQVMIVATDASAATALRAAVIGLDGEITAHFDRWIDAYIPVANLVTVAQMAGVVIVKRPIPVYPVDGEPTSLPLLGENSPHPQPLSNVERGFNTPTSPPRLLERGPGGEVNPIAGRPNRMGANLTQGYYASNMATWNAFGQAGQGVRIAILDSFYNYQSAQALGELPGGLQIYGTLDLSSPHGTAVAEIIYDMAPGAIMTIASPPDFTSTAMAQYIIALAQAGNRIISSSIGPLYTGAGDGNDPLSAAISQARTIYNTLYFQAGGNQAQKHWDGAWVDGGHGYQAFSGNIEVNELGYIQQNTLITLYLRWNAWPTTNQDYDLLLWRWNPNPLPPSPPTGAWEIYASSLLNQAQYILSPEEGIEVFASTSAYYGFSIQRYSASGLHTLSAISYRQSFSYPVADRSLIDPATGAFTIGVAALDVNAPYNLEGYSSRGPTYGPGGTFAGGMAQPRIAGYANVNTYAYGLNAFNGTSAATPHVAGAAAVVMSGYPYAPATQIQTYLEGRAVDMGTAGWDSTYGYGRLNMGDPPNWDTLVMFNPTTNMASRLVTLQDSPPASLYYTYAPGAPSTGQWVVGDWNGDGWRTPGFYNANNGVFYFTNEGGATANWGGIWFGLFNRPPVVGRFGAGNNDCIGVVDNGNFPPYGLAFAMYYTCNVVSGNPPKSFQWLSVVLPDNQGFSGTFQFTAGDWNADGRDTVAIRRGPFIAFTNSQVTSPAAFNLAQYWGTPSGSGEGRFLSGDWNGDGLHSFGVVYDDGSFYRRDDLEWNSGVYRLQRVSLMVGANFTVASWHPTGQSHVTGGAGGNSPSLSTERGLGGEVLIESDDGRVTQIGVWSLSQTEGASGGQILTSGHPDAALILPFDGTAIEIIYGDGGVFTVWVDDVAVRTIITTGDGLQGQRTRIDYLSEGSHALRIEAVQGSVAIDAFVVNPRGK